MTFESEEVHPDDPADQLRADIESAIASQEKGGEREPEPIEAEAGEESAAAEEPADERERDELGRFKAKGDGTEEAAEQEEKPAEEKAEPTAAEPAKAEVRPPAGFSVASKAIWDELPQSVRDDIAKREGDIENGLKRYSGLAKFAEEAERNGTTLQNAVATYSAIENELKTNFVGALEFLCGTFKIDPRKLANVMAQRYGVATTQNPGQTTTQNPTPQQVPAFDPEALTRQFHEIARAEAQAQAQAMRAESERATIDSQIEAFGADPKNKFFPNLRHDMAALVQAGKANNLKEAYDAASWLNPETRAILIAQDKAAQRNGTNTERDRLLAARNAAKAVGGAPGPGTNPDAARRQKDLSLDDEIRAAVDAQMGQI